MNHHPTIHLEVGVPREYGAEMVESLTSTGSVNPMVENNAQTRTAPANRPYVLTNMVSSMDGAIAIDGVSAGLGGPADFEVFMSLRSVADAIIAGAGTVRDEQYSAPNPGPEARRLRSVRGQTERALITVVTASGRLSPELPLFNDPTYRPLIVCGSEADADAVARLHEVADVVQTSNPSVSPEEVLAELQTRAVKVALLEGGPRLNGAFVASDCIDEWNLTLSPALVGGSGGRASNGSDGPSREFSLSRTWTAEDLLFLQWQRRTVGNET